MSEVSQKSHCFARNAMATRFEIVLPGGDEVRMRAIAEEAFDEIARLERQLSLYLPSSEISLVNARAAHEPVRVSPETMRLLLHTARLNAETDRAFDVTIGPLVRAWGFMGGSGQMADASAVAEARSRVGMPHVELNEAARTVRFAKPGMMLDLGAIGKGYAVDCAAELLMEAGVASALIHGGTSAVYAVGRPHEGDSWNVAIEFPEKSAGNPQWVAKVELCDEALSVSAISGKSFHEDGREFGHVIDPRTGEPVNHTHLAAIISPSATEADALSTALLTSGLEGMNRLARNRPGLRMAVVPNDGVPRGIGIRFQEGQRNV